MRLAVWICRLGRRGAKKHAFDVTFAVFVLLPEPPACISNKICAAQEETTKMESKIEVLATVKVQHSDDLYKIVDCLNRTLKRDNLMFGLALDENDKRQAIFTIYRT
ncbi:hypothetical protein I656_02675 [Geobacillus sp. WSUCF1]|nr:hypothetical protein I656_02675 [Geobacillus sp. WSUCF1]